MNELPVVHGANSPGRWTLIRDVTVLQGKLIIDGLRDFFLVPISIGAGVVSLLKSGDGCGTEFYDLLRLGRRTERWINLFGAADRVQGTAAEARDFPVHDLDEIVARVESYIVEEYQSGGVTEQAKSRLDQAIDSLYEKVRSDKR